MAKHLINTFNYELKGGVESLKYFEKIELYDKYMVIIENNKTHYDTIKLISNDNNNISICRLFNNSNSYYYHKINNNNIIRGDNRIINMMLYDKLLILINPNFIKCINILTHEIVLDIDYVSESNVSESNRRYYLFNNLIFYEKCINSTGWIYDTYIFNLDTYETRHLKNCSVHSKTFRSHPEYISNDYINKNIYSYSYSSYSSSSSSSNQIISLNKLSIDNRFIFLNYHKQYTFLYDTLKNIELKHTIMYGSINILFVQNYIINYINSEHELSYHMIDFSNYIPDIYEKEKNTTSTTQLNDNDNDIKDELSENEYIKDAIIIEDELSDNDDDKKCELKYNLYDRWMLNDEHDKCTLCYKKFIKFLTKKNHCRSCGRLACSPCTNFYGKGKIIAGMPVSEQNKIKSNQNVKICIKCVV